MSDEQELAAAKIGRDAWTAEWQTKARPFMTRVIVVLAVFFFVGSFAQLIWLNWHIAHPPTIPPGLLLDSASCAAPGKPAMPSADCLELQQRRALLLLEENIVSRRYHQSNAIVMFSVWSRYLGFVTGMILAFVGSAFILGKMTEPSTTVSGEGAGMKAALSSTSPGLVMSFLGVVLMVASIVTLHSLSTKDGPTYLGWGVLTADEATPSGVKLKPERETEDGPTPQE
ncbi:MAG: hypothetical protein EPO51_06040 [Phenylobacterium sp.]|uniref:hypothetical protein n=1 Tax=Phenylobacterium sp. TaxID=1871053 RepID=UPI0012077018|nr:hypothetical protein [Phenylobacterium sp.]TAJ73194.1 MAG: hypothetical protein EPO51_06040 [Phenylobacterium sp.]